MRLLTTIATTLAQYHHFIAARDQLEARSDRQLADMGIDRADIVRLAWQEAERRLPLPAEADEAPRFSKTTAGPLDLAIAGHR